LPESSGSSGEANQLLRAAEKDWRTVFQLADLDRLMGLVAETGKDVTAYLDLGDFNPYAVELRYGLDDDQDSELDRPQLLDQCFKFRVAIQCWLANLSG
jgi:hypothetical protein